MEKALVFDVDGVVVDTPHESAWFESLADLAARRGLVYERALCTPELYQRHVAGKPRRDGAAALLAAVGLDDPEGGLADALAEAKQRKVEELIAAGHAPAFPDAVRLVGRAAAAGWRLAVASSSQNANAFLALVPFGRGSLRDAFEVNVCGRRFDSGKPAPDIFRAAIDELGLPPAACAVIEDAPVGIEAARAAGAFALGIARRGDEHLLRQAGADLIVRSLDEVDLDDLAGRLLAVSG